MRFYDAYNGWKRSHLTQDEAGLLLGMSGRNFRRYIERYHDKGEAGLLDKRLTQTSHRCAPVDEVLQFTDLYGDRYNGWNVKHFYSFYIREHEGERSYSWVKNELQKADLFVPFASPLRAYIHPFRGVHNYRITSLFHGPRKLAEFPPVQKPEVSKPEPLLPGLKAMK